MVTALERLRITDVDETNDHVKGHYKWLQLFLIKALFVLLAIYKEKRKKERSQAYTGRKKISNKRGLHEKGMFLHACDQS